MIDMNDKYLIDKGWEQMSDLLDKKMPQKSGNDRRIVFLLLFLLIGLVSGYLILDTADKNKKVRQEKPPKTRKVSSKNSFAALNDDANRYNPTVENENVSRSSMKKSKSGRDAGIATNRNMTYKSLADSKSISAITNDNSEKQNLNNSTNSDVDSKLNDKAVESVAHHREVFATYSLDNSRIYLIKFDTPVLPVQKIKPWFHFSNKRPWMNGAFAVDLAVVSENVKSFGGMSSGVEYSMDLSNRVGIGAGVDFSFFRKNGMSNSFLTNVLKVPAYDGSEESDKVRVSANLTPRYREEFNLTTRNPYALGGFIDKLYYVGLPVSVYYKTKRYRATVGFKTSFLINGSNFTANKNLVGGQNYVIYSKNAFFKAKVYNRFDYSSFLSIDYLVWKRVSVFGKFNYSFTNILSSPKTQLSKENPGLLYPENNADYKNRYDNNIYFGLGIKYGL